MLIICKNGAGDEKKIHTFKLETFIDLPGRFQAYLDDDAGFTYNDEIQIWVDGIKRFTGVVDNAYKTEGRLFVEGWDYSYHAWRRTITCDTGKSYDAYSGLTCRAVLQTLLEPISEISEGTGNASGGTYEMRFDRGTRIRDAAYRIAEIDNKYFWVGADKKWYFKAARGTTPGLTLAAGQNILSPGIIASAPIRPMGNRITLLGGGVGNNQVTVEKNDTSSQATYGIIERIIEAKDIYNVDTLSALGDTMLARMAHPIKQFYVRPARSVTTWFEVGDTVTLIDATHGVNGNYICVKKIFTEKETEAWFSDVGISNLDINREIASATMHFAQVDEGAPTCWQVNLVDNCDAEDWLVRTVRVSRFQAFTQAKMTVFREKFRGYAINAAGGEGATSAVNSTFGGGTETAVTWSGTLTAGSWTNVASWQLYPYNTSFVLFYVRVRIEDEPDSATIQVRVYDAQLSKYYPSSDGFSTEIVIDGHRAGMGQVIVSPILIPSDIYNHSLYVQIRSPSTINVSTIVYHMLAGQHTHLTPYHTHDLVYGVYTPSSEESVNVEYRVWKKGTSRPDSADGTIYNLAVNDESPEIDLSDKFTSPGTWYVELKPTGLCRLNGMIWFETFIRSEV